MSSGQHRPEGAAAPADGPTVLRIIVGTHLKRLRELRRISRAVAANAIRGSEAKISRMESGRVGFKRRDVDDLLTLYGVTEPGERDEMVQLALQANQPGWWQRYHDAIPDWFETYVGLEQAATSIRTYESQFVPGLLQTEEYAQAVIELGRPGTAAEKKQRLALRTGRQEVLDRTRPPGYWAVVDEAALRRAVGGPEVMRRQVDHLLAISKRPNVTLQILPLTRGGEAGASGSFILLRYADPDLPDNVYIEQLTSALYLDRRSDVETYLMLIDRLAAIALTPRQSREMLTSLHV